MKSKKKAVLTASTDMYRRLKRFSPGVLFFLLAASYLPAQTGGAVSLSAELSGLEKTASGASTPGEKYDALLKLSLLSRLSGDSDSQLEYLEQALELFPGGGKALLEQGRLFISRGEYERAAVSAAALLGQKDEKDVLLGRLLFAQIEAFRSGNTGPLEALAAEKGFAAYHSGIYYTLWKLSGLSSWKTRLTEDFPLSPEAKIAAASGSAPGGVSASGAASSGVVPKPVPHWLLFSGRESIRVEALSPPVAAEAAGAPAAPSASALPAPPLAALQTGIFGKEENARAMTERLAGAGFEPRIVRRTVNGADYWAVHVSGGADTNAMMKKLKDAGFDSFPVK